MSRILITCGHCGATSDLWADDGWEALPLADGGEIVTCPETACRTWAYTHPRLDRQAEIEERARLERAEERAAAEEAWDRHLDTWLDEGGEC